MRWPIGIAVAFGIVVLVNLLMAWYAIGEPPELEPSYETETR